MSSPTTSTGAHRVFVYGTLKKGLYNHRLLSKATFVADVRTREKSFALLLAKAGYPYLIRTTDDPRSVPGELYECDDDTLAELDVLEEISTGMYSREILDVEVVDVGGAERDALSAFFYLAGARDDLNALPRIDAYTKELHDDVYLPKDQRTGGAYGSLP
jgi:gamma-glutamylaminecyclotransferase